MKKKQIAVIGVIIFLFLGLPVPFVDVAEAGITYDDAIIIGDTVYVDVNGKAMLSQTPHTLTDFENTAEITLTSYWNTTKTIDIAFCFDKYDTNIKPTGARYLAWVNHPNEQPVYGNVFREHIVYNVVAFQMPDPNPPTYVDIGRLDANWHYNVTIDDPVNGTYYAIVGFDAHEQINSTTYKIKWLENALVGYEDAWYWDWVDIPKSAWSVTTWQHQKVYYLTFSIDPLETKKMQIDISVDPSIDDVNGKYDIFLKFHDDGFKESLETDRYVYLDPWIDFNFGKRMALQIDNTGCTTALTNHQVFMNVSYQDGMNTSFDDLRFSNESSNEIIPYQLINKTDGVWANVVFNVSYLAPSDWTNDTYYMYWNNSEAESTSNGSLTYLAYDDFNRTNSGDIGNGWTEYGDYYEIHNETVRANSASADYKPLYISTGTLSNEGIIVECYGNVTANYQFGIWWDMNLTNDTGYFAYGDQRGAPYNQLKMKSIAYPSGNSTTIATSSAGFPANKWQKFTLIVYPDTRVEAYLNSTYLLVNGITDGETDFVPTGTIGVHMLGNGGDYVYMDNFSVRKYASPQPTVFFGAIENRTENSIPPTPTNIESTVGVWWVNYTWEPGFEGYYYQNDTVIVDGLGDVGVDASPTVFVDSDVRYMIAGNSVGGHWGYNWTGTTWQNDSAIVSGLHLNHSSFNKNSPAVFQINGIWYLIESVQSGPATMKWVGYEANSTDIREGWHNATNYITSGLPVHGTNLSAMTIFYNNSILYGIVGTSADGGLWGYNWTGTTWQNDSAIVSGLPVSDAGLNVNPFAYYNWDDVLIMVTGISDGTMYGYTFNGTGWTEDLGVYRGLEDVGTYADPTGFNYSDTWYVISGNYDGTFYGFNWTTNITDRYNVSIWNETTEVWTNLTTNTSINTTASSQAWVNITIQAVNLSGNKSVSESYATQSTQLPDYCLKIWCFNEINGTMLNGFWTDINSVNKTAVGYFTEFIEDELPFEDTYLLTIGCDGYETRTVYVTLDEQTNLSTYLLGTGDGAYINFHVSDGIGYALPGVYLEAIIDGDTVEGALTDSTGTSRLYLDATTTYVIRLSKAGYTTQTFNILPTSSNYYLTMASQTSPEAPVRTTTWHYYPTSTAVQNLSSVVFMLNTSSLDGNIEYWSMKIENSTHVLFNETNTSAYGGSIIADLDLSEYETGDEIYSTITLKEFGKEPLTLMASPCITHPVYSLNLSENSLYRVISDVGDDLGPFASNFLALFLTLFFVGMVSVVAPPGSYGGGIMGLIMLGFFGFCGWMDTWLLMLVGMCALGVYAMRGGTG